MHDDNQIAYDWIEECPEADYRRFLDWAWAKERPVMRQLIRAYVETEGKEAFQAYLAYMESPENQANLKADQQMDDRR